MDLNEIWRFDLVRGFTRDPSHGACLLTAVSWLVDGKLTDRPRCVCPLLAQFGRYANDILYQKDRQRLKAFIYRLGGSRDSSAIERRARIIVDGIMRGSLGGRATLSPDRLVSYLAWVRAICSLRLGWYRAAADRALSGLQGAIRDSRALAGRSLQTFSARRLTKRSALVGRGKLIQRMQLRQWIDMSGKPDSSHRSFEAAHAVMALK